MLVGYLRVSSADERQSVDLQRDHVPGLTHVISHLKAALERGIIIYRIRR
jgi:hypothetical protein